MKKIQILLSLLVVLTLALSACAPAASEPAAESPAGESAPAEESMPKAGGSLVWSQAAEPDTLDWHLGWSLNTYVVDAYISASLLYLDADKNIIPYLAESYTVSDDRLVYEFKIRKDVKFHDGTPLTAQDFVWTFERAVNPETASPVAASMFGPVEKFEAVDDYTLRITLTEEFYPLLFNLADPGYTGPMSQEAFEKMGAEAFARAPVGVGPYKVKEWVTGETITLERNPDYNWGPASFKNQGAYYIETLVFRTVPEASTVLAGLQAGEIQFAQLERKDVASFKSSGDFTVYEQTFKGLNGFFFNISKPPFDDVKIRQAFNLAFNRQAMIDLALQGMGEPQFGPLSKPQIGYWDGVEKIGYGYDLEKAKSLLQEAGYTYNTDGMLEKDGKPFSVIGYVAPDAEHMVKTMQVAQQQLKELGVDMPIQQEDGGALFERILGGDYEMTFFGYTAPEADIMHLVYYSAGGLNMGHVADPELDALLEKARAASDAESRAASLADVQRLIVEKAYVAPLYVTHDFYALDNRVAGASMHFFDVLNLADAYFK